MAAKRRQTVAQKLRVENRRLAAELEYAKREADRERNRTQVSNAEKAAFREGITFAIETFTRALTTRPQWRGGQS